MSDRYRAALTSVVLVALAGAALAPAVAAQSELRTPDGYPDLQGLWNFSTATPMQRPDDLAGRDTLTAEEAAEWEQALAERRRAGDSTSPTASLEARVSYEQAIWFEQGNSLERQRTSLIIDPPNGRIPAVRPDAEARGQLTRLLRGRHAHGPEDRGVSERCLLGFNSGPPMTPSVYNNNMQLFQTADHVVILNEMVHTARIVPLDGRAPLPEGLRQWVGDSRGSWEGDTLVVVTTNFLRETAFGGSSANLHLVERISRVDADTLRYEFTVSDPTTWAAPWTARVDMTRTDEPLYEYACHEGNYSMASSLSGARALEAAEGGSDQ
ncbi:MAG: hypothetical protein OXG72_02475 [Acidobacteria bacterium]|nr:hypothetical protein [Acidobacteriota bacterium]